MDAPYDISKPISITVFMDAPYEKKIKSWQSDTTIALPIAKWDRNSKYVAKRCTEVQFAKNIL